MTRAGEHARTYRSTSFWLSSHMAYLIQRMTFLRFLLIASSKPLRFSLLKGGLPLEGVSRTRVRGEGRGRGTGAAPVVLELFAVCNLLPRRLGVLLLPLVRFAQQLLRSDLHRRRRLVLHL